MKYFKIILFLGFLTSSISFANENISKLNTLYLNGVLDKDTYFKSLENLGVDTSNNIFQNLFGLFSDKVLDLNSYEKSINDLISLSSSNNKQKVVNQNDKPKYNLTEKNYQIDDCKGDSTFCRDLKDMILSYKIENGNVVLDQKKFQPFIDSVTELTRIMKSNNIVKNDQFDNIVTILHVRGFLIDFVSGGYIEGGDFFLNELSIRVQGTELLSSKLVKIQ